MQPFRYLNGYHCHIFYVYQRIQTRKDDALMTNSTYLQVRTSAADKEQASAIVEELGTNLSTVVNMLLKQIIITRSIPFQLKLAPAYSGQEAISEVRATMAMEHMPLNEEDISRLEKYQHASAAERESIRSALLQELLEV